MDSSAQVAAILDEIVETRQRRAESVTEVLGRINAVVSDLTHLQRVVLRIWILHAATKLISVNEEADDNFMHGFEF